MSDKDFANTGVIQLEIDNSGAIHSTKPMTIASLSLAFAMACFAVGFFMGEKYALEASKGNKQAELLNTVKNQQKELEELKSEAKQWQQKEAQTSEVGELTFYNELPKQSVIPEPIHASDILDANTEKPVIKVNTVIDGSSDNLEANEDRLDRIIEQEMAKPSHIFRIQFASFKEKQESEIFVDRLKEVGVKTVIQRVDLENLGIRYRVKSTPYSEQDLALKTMDLVKEKFQITGIIISE